MMAAHSPARPVRPRLRAWRPKSTTGCITCKVRRVKCDEAKPYCNRCTSTGRHCDGYASPGRNVSSPPTSASLTSSSPSSVVSSLEESESFDFFLNYAIKDLCGYFDSPFWQRELLQAAHYHPAIRHGVIAVGAMHQRFVSDSESDAIDVADKQLRFALEHSNKAIQELVTRTKTSPTSEPDLKTIMTCAVLFSTLACLQGEQQEALSHIRCGVRLMRDLEAVDTDTAAHPVSLKSLRKIFISLNVQAMSIMSSADLMQWETVPASWLDKLPSFSLPWSSLEDANHYFESLLVNVLAFLQGRLEMPESENPDSSARSGTARVFSKLRQRFHTGMTQLNSTFPGVFSNTTDAGSLSIRLMCAQIELFLMIFSSIGEEPGGRFEDAGAFEAMMSLITRLEDCCTQHHESNVGRGERGVYSSTNGPLSTLFLVATRAPSVQLRKRAIWTMLSHKRRDGLWDGRWAGKIAQEALTLEETTAKEELGIDIGVTAVPSQFRVRDISISYRGPKQATCEFRNERMIEKGERGWVRSITW